MNGDRRPTDPIDAWNPPDLGTKAWRHRVRNAADDPYAEVLILARTLFAEAQSEGLAGMEAIMVAILNRMYNSPYKYKTFRDVVLEKGAFTPWNKNEWGSPNTKRAWALAPPGNDNDHLNAEQEAIWSMAWDVAERM